MKKFVLALGILFSVFFLNGQDLHYYLPAGVTYNPAIPKPNQIIYHEVGEWHITHDRLVNYMKAVAQAAPTRVKLETMGYTYEGRPQLLLIFTSPGNHARLEQIRQQHVQLTDPAKSVSLNIDQMPAVVWIGHSIHGNEPSGANASLVSAYHLAAAQGKEIEDMLEQVVILFDPSFNPDGLQRFSTWANQHKSKNLVSDPNSREFNEVWPGGRFNHYWFDLNRDWLPAVHVESQNRLKWFHHWKPNILTDHHEQGSNATFFFQPGVPSRVNALTPQKNQELTAKLAAFHAQYLDRIGSMYFTKENYDDFYYGKGSTYPDVQGCIGILFEQGSSRGHLQQTANGLLSFPFTIRNQFVTALSTLEGAKTLRKELLGYQRDFYRQAPSRADAYPVKGYVFGDKNDPVKTYLFAEMLQRHQVELYQLPDQWSDPVFEKGNAYLVPMSQPQHSLIRAVFEKTKQFSDSLFYDITAWTIPLALGLPHKELISHVSPGSKVETVPMPKGSVTGGQSNYAYLIEWDDLYAPAALYELLQEGYLVKAATVKTEIPVAGSRRLFHQGTLLVPVAGQQKDAAAVENRILTLAEKYSLSVAAVQGGSATSGPDLGSSRFFVLTKPHVALLVGPGANPLDAGEVWHLLDQRMNIPATHLEASVFNRIDPSKYNTIILAGAVSSELNKEKLKSWVQGGGILILTEEAVSWAAQSGIMDIKFKKAKAATDTTQRLRYADREQVEGAQQIRGAIFEAEPDPTHPLAFGYHAKAVNLFKANRVFMEKSKNPFATPFIYGSSPLQSGWVSRENLDAIKNSAAVVVSTVGLGRVISIADNPNFRAFWLGGSKLFMNAIFFGKMIDAGSARTEE